MPKKLPEIVARRLFTNQFVCMKCNAKLRAHPDSVKRREVKCRKCGYKALRLKAKERRSTKV